MFVWQLDDIKQMYAMISMVRVKGLCGEKLVYSELVRTLATKFMHREPTSANILWKGKRFGRAGFETGATERALALSGSHLAGSALRALNHRH